MSEILIFSAFLVFFITRYKSIKLLSAFRFYCLFSSKKKLRYKLVAAKMLAQRMA